MSADRAAAEKAPVRPATVGNIDTSFERLLGRQATESERARLYRLREVLGLRDNDAFWGIVMALEHYDSFFRTYPAQLAEVTARSVENVRAACAAAAQEEVAAVQRALAEKVADTSVTLARNMAARPLDTHQVTVALAAVVAFGSLCVHAGYELATGGRPFWVSRPRDSSTVTRLLSNVLFVPAGWMMFALLLPAAVRGAALGWRLGVDPLGEVRERLAGWCLVVCCVLGAGACALVLAHLA